jgi:signal transduction histidine kinase
MDAPAPAALCPVQRYSTTVVMSIAAVCAALISMAGDTDAFSTVTLVAALVGLVPWAVEAGGLTLSPGVFLALTAVPAGVIVLVDRNPGGMFPMMLVIVSVTRRSDAPWVTAAAVGAGLSMTVGLAVLEGTTHETGAVYFAGGVGVAWLAGSMIRRQEILLAELRVASERQNAHAAAAERTRIAREVHDVVAHSLTVTLLNVSGARRTLASDPDRAAEALERAETVGRESLDSIRQIVGLLRDESDTATTGDQVPPLPALADIPTVVAQFRSAGLSVDADIDLGDVSADPATALAGYRVVQEALSNVMQHAPGSPVALGVRNDRADGVLRITAVNPIPAAGPRRGDRSGLGLRGMSERVRAAGGDVSTGVDDNGQWRVEASLPLRRATTARA